MLFINCMSIYLIVASIAIISYATRIKTLSGASYAKPLLALSLAICIYILGYVMELNSLTPEEIVFWNEIEYIGIPFVAGLWLMVSSFYCGYHNKKVSIAIFAIPVLTLILRMTNRYHHLYFAATDFTEEFGRLFYKKTPGPWMNVQLIYSALSIVISFYLLFMDILKSKQKQRGKILLLIAASVVILAGLLLPEGILLRMDIDYTALCLPVTCLCVMAAISYYDFLEVKSLARSKAFEASRNAILFINCQHKMIDYNKSAEMLFSKMHFQLTTQDVFTAFREDPELVKAITSNVSLTPVQFNIGKEIYYYNIITEKIYENQTLRGWVKVFLDVTESHRNNEFLSQLAMTDELSVLDNRRAFIKKGKELIAAAETSGDSLHVIMLDLDYFKKINDQYGHLAGDFVIREFSQMLKQHFDTNCQVARLGGEEFAIICVHYSTEEVLEMIRVFLADAGNHEYYCFENRFHVTVSVGVALWKTGQLLENILKLADAALYRSKAQGRNCITMC